MWCVPELNDEYVAAMEDVLETYEKAYDSHQPVVCLDEKPITLHADTRPSTPVQPGKERRRDYEYQRCGTANAFCAIEPKAGRHFVFITPDRTAVQFAQALFHLAMAYPDAQTIHLVLDNLNIHCRKSLINFYGEEIGGQIWDRFTVHHTPKHASWLNQAEIQISLFSRQCLGNRRIADLPSLGREAAAWTRRANRKRITIQWTFDRKAARKVFGYKCIISMRSKH
jgi:DDE superfamily endonuclease